MKVLQRNLIFFAYCMIASYGGRSHDGDEESAVSPLVNLDYIPPSLLWNSSHVRQLHHGSGHGNPPPKPVRPPVRPPVSPPVRPPVSPPGGQKTRLFIKLSSLGDVTPAEAGIKNVILQVNNGPNLLSDQASSMKGVPWNRGKSSDWEIFSGKTKFMSWYGTLRPWGKSSTYADLYGDGEGLYKEIMVPVSANEIEQLKLYVDLRFGRGRGNPNRKYVMETGIIGHDEPLTSVTAAPTVNDPGHRGWQTYQASYTSRTTYTPPPLKWLGWNPNQRKSLNSCEGDCDQRSDCPDNHVCGGPTIEGDRVPGCGGTLTSDHTGKVGHYCYNPNQLSDYGTNAYVSYKPLLLCEGRCNRDYDCGNGLWCWKGNGTPPSCSFDSSYNDSATGGFCIYPFMRLAEGLEPKRCETCAQLSSGADPCPKGLVCTKNNAQNFQNLSHQQLVMPGCTAVDSSHLNVADYYCTAPALVRVENAPKLGRCQGNCVVGEESCLPGLVCQERHGNEEVRGCSQKVELRSGREGEQRLVFGMNVCVSKSLFVTTRKPVHGAPTMLRDCEGARFPFRCPPGLRKVSRTGFEDVSMCGGHGIARQDYCDGGKCPRKRPYNVNGGRNAVQKHNVDQRMAGEGHCCFNFYGQHYEQATYVSPFSFAPVKPSGGACQCGNGFPDGYVYVVKVNGDIPRLKIGCTKTRNNEVRTDPKYFNCFRRFQEEFYVGTELEFFCIKVTNAMPDYERLKYIDDLLPVHGPVLANCNAAEVRVQDYFYCKDKWMGKNYYMTNLPPGAKRSGRTEWFGITMQDAACALGLYVHSDYANNLEYGTTKVGTADQWATWATATPASPHKC